MVALGKIGFIGGGVMGEAMVSGLLAARLLPPEHIAVADVLAERRDQLRERYGVVVTPDAAEAAAGTDVLVLAVKPQQIGAALGALRSALRPGQIVLSIAAGVTIEALCSGLDHQAVVRAIPNTPAQIGAGVTVWIASDVDATGRERVAAVLEVLGRTFEVHDEAYLDMATALSGSGPAFVFLFLESLIDAGVHVGLPRPLATALAIETVIGSGTMARATGLHAAALRNMVTSPGGTTAAGLVELEAGALRAAVDRAVVAAYERSRALGRGTDEQERRR